MDIIARAFELAPNCRSMPELRQALRKEGFSAWDPHLDGLGIRRELSKRLNGGVGMKKRGLPKREV